MKDQGYIDKDEIEPNHDEAHDPSNTGSDSQLPKDDSYFPNQLSSDLGSNKRAGASSPSKDDLRHSKMKNSDKSSEANQEGETEEMERQKIRKSRYSPDCEGISSMENGIETFEDLRKKLGFIDKTKFILDFHYELGEATCILRPRRSGKTMTIKMLKEFYWVPEIDVKSYNPDTKEHTNVNCTAKDVFKGTFVYNRNNRKEFWEKYEKSEKDTFIEDNMNKWPVIELNIIGVSFKLDDTSQKEINRILFWNVVKEAYEQYKDVIFLRVAEEVWKIKYGTFSNETYQKLLRDFNFHQKESIKDKIYALWYKYEKEMPAWVKDYFKIIYYEKTSFEDIETPLKTIVKIIAEFYNKPVIILVDEHDRPIQQLFWDIMDYPKNNKKTPELIRRASNTINSMLRAVGKGNQYVKKFLMLGILNNVVNYNNSDFDNLKINNVFETKYSEYFGMTQTEVDRVIDKLFPVNKEIKDKIRANINTWYNGYYHKQGFNLYSIFSTNLYISEWFEAYTKQYTESKDFQDYWIPEFEPFWANFGHLYFVNNYLNFDFGGKHGHFLRDLSLDRPAYYSECDPEYVPQFENTTDSEERVKILFHSMVHGGYLTQLNGDKKLFRIPNFELKRLLNRELDPYLLSFIPYKYIGDIAYEVIMEDIEGFGKMIIKSLLYAFLSQKYEKLDYGFPPLELFIYRLLLDVLDIIPFTWKYNFSRDYRARAPSPPTAPEGVQIQNNPSRLGSRVDFYFIEVGGGKKTHYVIELKADSSDAEGMKNKALEGLSKIFKENNQQHILPLPETQAIINIGLTFHANSVCLVVLKVHVADGKYVKIDPLEHLEFKADQTYEDSIKVDRKKQANFDLRIPGASKEPNVSPIDSDSPEMHNRKTRDSIFNRIEELKKSNIGTTTQNQANKEDQRKQ
jgi:hypothetical protein